MGGKADGMGDGEHDSRDDAHSGGVFIGGSVTGGALAAGKGSTARDSSRTAGGSSPADLPTPTAPAGPVSAGQVVIGGHLTGGAVAAGQGSEAVDDAVRIDEAHGRLLAEVAQLRRQVTLLAPSEDVAAADGELAAVQNEIERTGRAEPSRLRRLLARLTDANTALAALASAATVAQTIQGLIG